MSSLDKLPSELLDLILRYTTPACQRKLLYTCRRLHQIVLPQIYRKIHITLRPEDVQDHNAVIVQLFYTVSTSPWLADYVQELEIYGSKPLILSTQLSRAQALSFMRTIPFSHGVYMHFLNRLMKGDTDAIIALLISLLGNLRVLRLGFDIWSDSRYLSTIFSTILHLEEIELSSLIMAITPSADNERNHWDNPSLFDNTLIFKTDNGPLYYDPKQFEHIFLRPRIKTVKLMVPEPRNEWLSPPPNNQTESCSKLTRLCLEQSELTPSSLRYLLRLTPTLQDLEYIHCININQGGDTMRYFQCADMDAALQPVLPCLERLCISVAFFTAEAVDVGWGFHWGFQDTLACLANGSCLSYLEIQVVLLLGWTPFSVSGANQLAAVLPLSLRHLTLTNDLVYFECNEWTRSELYRCVGDYVQTVTAAATLQAPVNLKHVTLNCSMIGLDLGLEFALSRLKHICVEADVGLHINEYKW